MGALLEKCRFGSKEVPADILTVFALADQGLSLERQVTKRKQARAEGERKLQVANSAVPSAHHNAFVEVKKVRKCREELEDADERLGLV